MPVDQEARVMPPSTATLTATVLACVNRVAAENLSGTNMVRSCLKQCLQWPARHLCSMQQQQLRRDECLLRNFLPGVEATSFQHGSQGVLHAACQPGSKRKKPQKERKGLGFRHRNDGFLVLMPPLRRARCLHEGDSPAAAVGPRQAVLMFCSWISG
jgi:hypothetical protein